MSSDSRIRILLRLFSLIAEAGSIRVLSDAGCGTQTHKYRRQWHWTMANRACGFLAGLRCRAIYCQSGARLRAGGSLARLAMKQTEPTRQYGFTLVELLVVIGIIAVLIAILLPVLSKTRASANRVACLSNLRELHKGIVLYCNDNNGFLPTDGMPADGIGYIQMDSDWVWWEAD